MLRSFIFITLSASACLAQITRLPPSAFPELPAPISAELARRSCTIPQVPGIAGPHNVIHGSFAAPGRTDWAVLCSVNDTSSILIFWNGSPSNPASIESQNDAMRMQSDAQGKMVYSRQIAIAGKAFILEHYKAYGGPKPPPIDHQGIDDRFVGKASEVQYFYNGKWLRLTGSD